MLFVVGLLTFSEADKAFAEFTLLYHVCYVFIYALGQVLTEERLTLSFGLKFKNWLKTESKLYCSLCNLVVGFSESVAIVGKF